MSGLHRTRRAWTTTLGLVLALGCGGGPGEVDDAGPEPDDEGRIVLPPSAEAPRATLPGGVPDTLRPAPDTAGPASEEWRIGDQEPGRHRSPEDFDLQAIVDGYRRYYTELYFEEGSDVRGGIDPILERDAKRRTALDWGYVEVGAWADMVDDMTGDQRIVLADRISAANVELARRHHGASP